MHRGLLVTDGLLPVLGATPLLGRSFTQADDEPGSPDTVMLTYGYWQRKFGSDRSMVGKVITVDGTHRTKFSEFCDRISDLAGRTLACSFRLNSIVPRRFSYPSTMMPSPGSGPVSHWRRPTRTWGACSPSCSEVFPHRRATASRCLKTREWGRIYGR
jgi:hypothetical protein